MKTTKPMSPSSFLYWHTERFSNNPAKVIDLLLLALKDDDTEIRDSAIFLLQHFSNDKIFRSLLEALKNESNYTKRVESWIFVEAFRGQCESLTIKTMLNIFYSANSSNFEKEVASQYLTVVLGGTGLSG